MVIAAGSPVDTVYVVRSGEMQLALRRPFGGRQLVGLVGEGGVVADNPMFCEQPMPLDAITGTASTVIELDRDRLVARLHRSPSLSLRSTASVAKRLEQTQRRMITILTKGWRPRSRRFSSTSASAAPRASASSRCPTERSPSCSACAASRCPA